MRAKTINELNFERGQNPKAAMDIGGINLGKDFEIVFKKFIDEWVKKLEQLKGKTITTEMRLFVLDTNNQLSGWKQETIKIKEILEPQIKTNSIKDPIDVYVYLWVIGEINGKEYRCDLGDLNKKIYIE